MHVDAIIAAVAAHDIRRIKKVFLALASYSKPPFRLLRAA
jgi:hypothetical protein